jgi:hypothetical protein
MDAGDLDEIISVTEIPGDGVRIASPGNHQYSKESSL